MKTANKIMMPNGEEIQLGGGGGSVLFDTKLTDHILTYEESEGWALQGTYVYKEAVAGSRYGYPDFYAKCVEEYEKATEVKWVQPVLTGDITQVAEGEIVCSASSYYATENCQPYCAMDGVKGGTNAQGGRFVINKTTTGWWQVKFPYKLKITGLTYYAPYSTGNASSIATTGRFYTSSYKTTPIGDVISTTSNWQVVDISNIPTEGIVTDTLYFDITNSGGYGGIGEIEITATYVDFVKHANGHIFYDISIKDKIDELYNTNGIAWYYGIDKENERIFLPRTKWFIQPTGEITEVNTVNEAGLPNIEGSFSSVKQLNANFNFSTTSGAFYSKGQYGSSNSILGTSGTSTAQALCGFEASRSSAVYGNSDTVQPPSINQLLYICVGNTNVESAVTDVVDVTTTENDTVPLGYSTYQNGIVPNTSWLKSQGQWNDGNVYTTFYNEFVQKIGQSFASGYVKEITEEYDDYDLVINQTDMTFRLPLLDGSESVIDYTTNVSIPTDVGSTFIAPKRGYIYALYANNSATANRTLVITINGVKVVQTSGYNTSSSQRSSGQLIEINKGDTLLVVEHNTSESKITFFPCKSNGSLYFKVANAVQNLELLDAGEVLEAVNDVVPNNRELITGWSFPSSKYIDLTLNASDSTYTAPANGWFSILKTATGDQYIRLTSNYVSNQVFSGASGRGISVSIPVSKGATVKITYNAGGATDYFRFIYAQGEV